MLRRAAPFVRVLRNRPLSTAPSAQSSNNDDGVRRLPHRERYGDRRQYRGDVNNERRPRRIIDEHTELLRKHGTAIENTEVESLSDAVERINWYSMVSRFTSDRVANLLKNATAEEISNLSDRSMSTLFSSFGRLCEEIPKEERNKILNEVIEELTKKGYKAGPLSRTTIFSIKIDNAVTKDDLPSIVDEISSWESSNLPLEEEILVQSSRVYAKQGNKKGVIELMNESKESFGRVDIRFIESIAHSMISCGDSNGMNDVMKLSSRANEDTLRRIWLNAAMGGAERGDEKIVIDCLTRIPLGSRLDHTDNNTMVVDILCTLIHKGIQGVEHTLTPFLALSPDGRSLHEKHSMNSILVNRTRAALNQSKIEEATRFYTIVHENYRSKYVEGGIKRGLNEVSSNEDVDVDMVVRTANRLVTAGIIEDADAFLISSLKGKNLVNFINKLRIDRKINSVMENIGEKRFRIASRCIRAYDKENVHEVLPLAASILFVKQEGKNERDDQERVLFNAANEDPSVILRSLESLSNSNYGDAEMIGCNITTSAISRLLIEKDVLSSGRIDTVLSSTHIPWIRISSFDGKLNRLLLSAKGEANVNKAVEIVSKIISISFTQGDHSEYAVKSIIYLVSNASIPQSTIELLIKRLSQCPGVGISKTELDKTKESLRKRGLDERAEMIEQLRTKSKVSARWAASSADELENELNNIIDNGDYKRGVILSLSAILLDKIVLITPVDATRVASLLQKINPTLNTKVEKSEPFEKSKVSRIRECCSKLIGLSMRQSVSHSDWIMAKKLWESRGSIRSLPVAPSLAISYHEHSNGMEESSKQIIESLRSSGLSVGASVVSELGDLLKTESMDELAKVSEWLKTNFRLESSDIARLHSARAKKQLHELIESGRLKEAFDMMKEVSQKTKHAFGHFELMRAAIKGEDKSLLEDILNLVSSLHSKPTAILDLAFSFLLENRIDYGSKLFKNPSLKLSYSKLGFYAKSAMEEKRVDVVRNLFNILVSCPVSEEKVSNADLNFLALTVIRYYVFNGKNEEIKSFTEEIEKSQFVIGASLKEIIERNKKISRSSSV